VGGRKSLVESQGSLYNEAPPSRSRSVFAWGEAVPARNGTRTGPIPPKVLSNEQRVRDVEFGLSLQDGDA
jgi:hypothetical protein